MQRKTLFRLLALSAACALAPTLAAGQAVVIDNWPGASSNLGTDVLAKSAPDGYTIGIVGGSHNNGGFLAPAGTPRAIVDKLNAEINAALKLPDVRAKLEGAGVDIQGGTPQDYAALMKSDLAKWGQVVKAVGIPLE